jgi:two-component system, cell cycle sensor histidine kinase and response regulator CckA
VTIRPQVPRKVSAGGRPFLRILSATSLLLIVSLLLFNRWATDTWLRSEAEWKSDLQRLVFMARSAIDPVVVKIRQGRISKQEALTQIRDLVRQMVYEDSYGKNYIFMSAYDGTMLVQPYEPDKEMTNQWDLRDEHGTFIIRELVRSARSRPEGGFVRYYYNPPTSPAPEEKLAFVIGIPELDCYLGTGTYLQQASKDQRIMIRRAAYWSIALVILLVILVMVSLKEVLARNHALAHEVEERRRAEEELGASREKYFKAFDSSPDAIGIARLTDGRILEANSGACSIFGYSREEFLGQDAVALKLWVSDEDRDRYLSELRERRTLKDFEVRFRRRSGQTGMGLVSSQLIEIRGEPCIIGILRDITERKQAEEELRASLERYRSLFEDSPVSLWEEDFTAVKAYVDELLSSGITDFRRHMETHPDVVRRCASLVKILNVNEATLGMYHVSSRAELLANLPQVFTEDAYGLFTEEVITVAEGRTRCQGESMNRTLSGEPIHVHLIWSVVPGFERSYGRVLVSLLDISDRKRTESALMRSEERFRLLAENSRDVIYRMSLPDGRYEYVSPAAMELMGYAPEEFYASPELVRRIIHPAWQSYFDMQFALLIAGDVPPTYEYQILHKSGEVRWLHQRNVLIRDESGRPTALQGVVTDISDRKRREQERRQQEDQIRHTQKLESLGVLAGGIAHDFNNLLMAILGHADLALRDLSPVSPVRENLEAIEKASRRAAELCRQMLAYSGKGRFAIQTLDLREIIEEMAHMLEVSISKKVTMRYDFGVDVPPIDGDPAQIRQVVMNLIINASEAIGDRSGVISVSTGISHCDRADLRQMWLNEELPDGLYVSLDVTDTGCGMDEKTLVRVFDPFFTTKFTGRGLGLAAVLGIVRGHKGAIRVHSEPGKGTTFKILLPASSQRAVQEKPATGTPNAPWGKGTILLVDDEEIVRSVGRTMLERLGFTTITAADGIEAMDVYTKYQDEITCVILDLTMPRMDGAEMFRELRQVRPDVRVIMSSGYSEQEVADRLSNQGIAGFIQKPYQIKALSDKLHEVLGT